MPSRLDHLIQYQVSEIGKFEKKQAITFQNGALIILNKPLKAVVANELVDARLQSVEDKGDSVQLFLVKGESATDQVQVSLTLDKGKYQIFNPVEGQTVDPHAEVDPNAGLPPDPSPDRIKEGPTEEGQSGEESGNAEQSGGVGE